MLAVPRACFCWAHWVPHAWVLNRFVFATWYSGVYAAPVSYASLFTGSLQSPELWCILNRADMAHYRSWLAPTRKSPISHFTTPSCPALVCRSTASGEQDSVLYRVYAAGRLVQRQREKGRQLVSRKTKGFYHSSYGIRLV